MKNKNTNNNDEIGNQTALTAFCKLSILKKSVK